MHLLTINRKELQKALSKVGQAVGTGGAEGCYQIDLDTTSQSMVIAGTNLETTVFLTIDADVSTSHIFLVEKNFFDSALSAMIGDVVVLSWDGQATYTIVSESRAGNTVLSFPAVDAHLMRLPDMTQFQDYFSCTVRNFGHRMNQIFITVSDAEDDVITCGVHFFTSETILWMESADRTKGLTRIALSNEYYEFEEQPRVLNETIVQGSAKILGAVVGNDDKPLRIGMNESNGLIRWTCGNAVVLTRLYGLRYDNTGVVYTYPALISARVNRKQFKAALDLVYLAADDHRYARMNVMMHRTHLELSNWRSTKDRSAQIRLDADVTWTDIAPYNEQDTLTFMVGAAYIDGVLAQMHGENVVLSPLWSSGRIVIVGISNPDDPAYQHRTAIFTPKGE